MSSIGIPYQWPSAIHLSIVINRLVFSFNKIGILVFFVNLNQFENYGIV